MDNKNLTSQSYEDKFGSLYITLCRVVNSMNKRMNLSYEVKIKMDSSSELKDIDDNIKNEVWWEMAMRLQLEKHILIDNSLSTISDALNKYDNNGNRYNCPFCGGNGKVTCTSCQGGGVANPQTQEPCNACRGQGNLLCKMCGGSGKAVDHELSLRYKSIVMTSNASRDICGTIVNAFGGGAPGAGQQEMEKMLMGLYESIYSGVKSGSMDRDEAMTALRDSLGKAAKIYGATDDDVEKFIDGYNEYEKSRDAESDGKNDTDDGQSKPESDAKPE